MARIFYNMILKQMKIELISENEIGAALDFIAPFENECVNIAHEILHGAKNCYTVKNDAIENSQTAPRNSIEKIVGIFCFRNRRTIFHCLPFTKYKTALDKILCQETQGAFYEFFADEKPFCINGEATGSLFLKNIFCNKKNPAHAKIVNEYFLMRKNLAQEKNAGADLPSQSLEMPQSSENEFRIFQAAPCDEEKLFPLERAYQFEEVIPPNFNVSEKLLRDSFRLNLQSQRIFALQIEGAPVAKAAITACGKNYALLGGVYTLPEFRRKGFATILIRHILRLLAAENKCASLYARKNKTAAVELYKNLGFESVAEYRIIYF